MNLKSRCSSLLILFFLLQAVVAFSQEEAPSVTTITPAASAIEPPYSKLFKTAYLDLSEIYNDLELDAIADLQPPPADGSIEAQDDQKLRRSVFDEATKRQIHAAKDSEDSVFSYAYTLGYRFSSHHLPKTRALFNAIDDDVRLAIYIAKRFYGRRRPMRASGYSYPSGHSTRAFLWAELLADIFPDSQLELESQAKVKSWNRVILGRHYPADTYAGKAFGAYLAQKLLNNPSFQKEWLKVQEEIKTVVGESPRTVSMHLSANSVP